MASLTDDKNARDAGDSDEGPVPYPSESVDERKLLRKLDLHLIPLVMALYLFSFLDR